MEKEFKLVNLRQAVSVVVFKGDRFLMVSGKDWPEGAWCFPQGGIKEDESHFNAVLRELKEELGTERFRVLGKSKVEHKYLFPEEIARKKNCDGQYQTVWFAEFLGDIQDIKPNEKELMNQAWFEEENIIKSMMYPEQRETFQKVLEELSYLRKNKIF